MATQSCVSVIITQTKPIRYRPVIFDVVDTVRGHKLWEIRNFNYELYVYKRAAVSKARQLSKLLRYPYAENVNLFLP